MKKFILAGAMTIVCTVAASFACGLNASAAGAAMSPVSTASYNVVDISHHNTVNDWTTLASNIDAVYIKATESNTDKYTDANLDTNALSAENAGLDFGFFHYFWPHATTEDAAAQADLFYSHISDYSYTCVPVLDVEESNGMTNDQIVADIDAFAEEFYELSGQEIMIYATPTFINTYLDSSLSSYKLWIAHYTTNSEPYDTDVWHSWTMWQYTDSGSIGGITGSVDCNSATDGIFLNSEGGTDTSGSYSLTADKNYSTGNIKAFNVTASFARGKLMVVTTLATGEQEITYQTVTATEKSYTFTVDDNAVKSTVYLIKDAFNGGSLPQSYGLAQFVTAS